MKKIATAFFKAKNKTRNRAKHLLKVVMLLLVAFLATDGVQGQTTYTFSSNAWLATPANWTAGANGNQLTSGRGIQVTTGTSGAFGNSPSFTNVTKIDVLYSTNASTGAGTIRVNSVASSSATVNTGTQIGSTFTVNSTGGTTDRTATFNAASSVTGNVQVVVTCSANSVYIKSVTITTSAGSNFTLAYTNNGGTGAAPAGGTFASGSTQTLAATTGLTRANFTTNGWNASAFGTTGTNYASGATNYTMPNANTTLYAQYDYTVSYDANSGSGAPSSQTSTNGANVTLSATVPTRSGFVFSGWNTSAGGGGTAYAAGASYAGLNGTTTLFAQWAAAPANDLCGAPAALTINGGTFNGTTVAASYTSLTNEPWPASSDVWYTFTPVESGNITINTSTTGTDYDLYAFTACPTSATSYVTGGNAATSSTTSESLTFAATAGTPYFIRVVNTTSTAGSAFTITATQTIITAPTLTTGTLTAFGTQCINSTYGPNSFTVSGTNLTTADVTIAALSGYTYSRSSGGTYTSSLSISQSGGTLASTIIYVKFTPTAVQSYIGNIVVGGGGAANRNVAASGAGINTVPTATSAAAGSITSTGATLNATGLTANCNAVTSYGFTYGTASDLSGGTTTNASNLSGGAFSIPITSLSPNTLYYYRAFGISTSGTGTGNILSFTTSAIGVVTANTATDISLNSFNANWAAVDGATGYQLDVSTSPTFGTSSSGTVVGWDFQGSSTTATSGITANNARVITTTAGSPAGTVTFTVESGTMTARANTWNSGNDTKFWEIANFSTVGYTSLSVSSKQRSSGTGPRDFKLQYKVGTGSYIDVTSGTITVANDLTTGVLNALALPSACENQASVSLRWIMTSNTSVGNSTVASAGGSNIDDIVIAGTASNPSFVSGYNSQAAGNVTTYPVTGLTANTTYYYRVRATSTNSTSSNSSTISVTTTNTVTWNGSVWTPAAPTESLDVVIDGAYNTNGGGSQLPFSAKSLTINSPGTLTIATGTNVTVANAIANNNANGITIENNANLVQTAVPNTNTGSGTSIVKRESSALKRLDYTLWSSPVAVLGSKTLSAFSPLTTQTPTSVRFYTYNPSSNFYTRATITNPFALATGYLIRMPDENPDIRGNGSEYYKGNETLNYKGEFTGTLNNGTIDLIDLASDKFHAVGNPYPSTISAASFLGANSTGGVLYFWKKTNGVANTNSSYATWTTLGGNVASSTTPNNVQPDGTIAVGQGFIVKTGAAATSLTFTNEMRTSSNSAKFFKTKKESDKSRVWLNLTGAADAFSQALIGYVEDATNGVDNGIDGKSFGDGAIELASSIDGESYTIQGRPAFDATDVVALNFKTSIAGTYNIAIDKVDGLFANGQDIFLVDKTTGTTTNLNEGAYTFTAAVGVDNTRFTLAYQKTLKVDAPLFNENSVLVSRINGTLNVKSTAVAINNVKVFDVQGRLVAERKNVKSNTASFANLKANQVLIVKVTSENNAVVTKKVLN